MTSALEHDGRDDAPLASGVDGAPAPGTLFAEKYRIEHLLGVGGMGYVLAAKHVHLDERVAIKMLLPERAKQDDTVRRFLREGRAAVKIRSEHVGRVLDVGSVGDVPYIVMEYLEGCDLADLLTRHGRLRTDVAVEFTLQACEAIAEAHAMGTVHRDLKPANLFLVRRADGSDCVKVLDFGISKMAAGPGEGLSMTRTASTVGTPLYMSPEQLKSARNVDARADLWSLGVILFELVSCRLPFEAESLAELSVKVLTEEPPDVRAFAPEVPAGVAEAIRGCLRRDLGARLASVADLAAALAPFGTPVARKSAEVIANVARNRGEGPGRDRVSSGTLPAAAGVGVASTVSSDQTPPGGVVRIVPSPAVSSASNAGNAGNASNASNATRSGHRRAVVTLAVAGVVGVMTIGGAAYGFRHRWGATPRTASSGSVPALLTPPVASSPAEGVASSAAPGLAAAPAGGAAPAEGAVSADGSSVAGTMAPGEAATKTPTTSTTRASVVRTPGGAARGGAANSRESGRPARAGGSPSAAPAAVPAVPPRPQDSDFSSNRHE